MKKQPYEVFEPIGFTEPIPSLNRPSPQRPRRPMGAGVKDSWSSGAAAGTATTVQVQAPRAARSVVSVPVRKRSWAVVLVAGTVAAGAAAVGAISVHSHRSLGQQVDQLVSKVSGAASQPGPTSELATPQAVAAVHAEPLAPPAAVVTESRSAPTSPPVADAQASTGAATPPPIAAPKPPRPQLTAELKSPAPATFKQLPPSVPPQLLSSLPPPAAGIAASAPALPASTAAPAASAASAAASSPPPAKKASEAEDSEDQQLDE